MTVADTRASLRDNRLLASGCDVSDYIKVVEEYSLSGTLFVKDVSYPYSNTQFSDYILWYTIMQFKVSFFASYDNKQVKTDHYSKNI